MLAGLFYIFLWLCAIVGLVAFLKRRRRGTGLALAVALAAAPSAAHAQATVAPGITAVTITGSDQSSNTITIDVTVTAGPIAGTYNNNISPSDLYYSWNGSSYTRMQVNADYNGPMGDQTAPAPQTVTETIPAPSVGAYSLTIQANYYAHSCGCAFSQAYKTITGTFAWPVGGSDAGPGPDYDGGSFNPTAFLPGDLSIGIPGIGDVGIPAGWPAEVMQFALQKFSQVTGLNPQAMSGQFATMLKTLDMSGPQLTKLMQGMEMTLLTPKESDTQGVKDSVSTFVNWGPYSYVSSIATAFHPSGLGTSAPAAPATPALSYMVPQPVLTDQNGVIPIYSRDSTPSTLSGLSGHVAARATASGSAVRAHDAGSGGTDGSGMATDGQEITSGQIGIPVMGVSLSGGVLIDQNGHTSVVQPGQWYDSGRRVPFDFSSFANAPAFQVLRQLMGAGVYISFAWLVILKMWPKQEF